MCAPDHPSFSSRVIQLSTVRTLVLDAQRVADDDSDDDSDGIELPDEDAQGESGAQSPEPPSPRSGSVDPEDGWNDDDGRSVLDGGYGSGSELSSVDTGAADPDNPDPEVRPPHTTSDAVCT